MSAVGDAAGDASNYGVLLRMLEQPEVLAALREQSSRAPALVCQLPCRHVNIVNVELDPGLRRRQVGGPLGRAKAGLGGLGQGPHREMLHPIDAAGMEVVAVFLKRQPQAVAVETARASNVGGNRPETSDKKHLHPSPSPLRTVAPDCRSNILAWAGQYPSSRPEAALWQELKQISGEDSDEQHTMYRSCESTLLLARTAP
ncbi:MAG: hypothetical protein ACHQ7M_14935 [Chloroflexota bacterium]